MANNSYQYSIYDPTGNVTALVESDVRIVDQPAAAAEIMKAHPEVEQVGFVRFPDPSESGYDAQLRMAGGEFCGNASCCTAVYYVLKHDLSFQNKSFDVKLRVSGTSDPVCVNVCPKGRDTFKTSIDMPAPLSICNKRVTYNQYSCDLPFVIMDGIVHVIITPNSLLYELVHNSNDAQLAVQKWCNELGADALGLMFLNQDAETYHLTPLVFVPGSGTTFWENSCASGTAAVGMYLAHKEGRYCTFTFHEPGGSLSVSCDPENGKPILSGIVRVL